MHGALHAAQACPGDGVARFVGAAKYLGASAAVDEHFGEERHFFERAVVLEGGENFRLTAYFDPFSGPELERAVRVGNHSCKSKVAFSWMHPVRNPTIILFK